MQNTTAHNRPVSLQFFSICLRLLAPEPLYAFGLNSVFSHLIVIMNFIL